MIHRNHVVLIIPSVKFKLLLTLVIACTLPSIVLAQEDRELDEIVASFTKASFTELQEVLSIPNDANFPSDIEKNILWAEEAFERRGFLTKRIETQGIPLLLNSLPYLSGRPTVLVYLQMDGQPVDPSKWYQPDPFVPVLKRENNNGQWEIIPWENIYQYQDDWRIFARAASDAKGPVMMFLTAIDAMRANNIAIPYNLKVICDFEEELGSPNLPEAVERNRELLAADYLLIFDGPMHPNNQPTLYFGARGIATMQMTTYGAIKPQHSGHYGNYVPNPAFKLANIISSLKDEEGRVLVRGFYDGIDLDGETKAILAATPQDEEKMMASLQIAVTEKVGDNYQEALQFPSLNVRGMQSGWINESVRTIIPDQARAEIDIRLVKESDPERLISLIRNHIEGLGYFIINKEPTPEERMKYNKLVTITSEISYQSFRTEINSSAGNWLRRAVKKTFEAEPVLIRLMGGSIPISPFVNALKVPAVGVPTVNMDNNQHSPNENLRLGNYREGIKMVIGILSEPIGE